ncbi:MAG TPA: peptidase M3, partial [Candidatus Marinimicrobia bacterium]|nr:peptidase M3 [Candidatus Neomarinimicrobiota bacterium]
MNHLEKGVEMRLGKLIAFTALVLLFSNCQKEINPLLTEWDTNFGSVPFEAIELQHFMPAFEEGIQHYEAEIKKIAENSEKATFENTIKALETSGELLWRTNRVFGVFNGANTNETLQNISKEISPRISRLNSDLYLNEALFQRVKTLYDSRESLILNEEELFVLDLTYKDFVHNGALLSSGNKEKLRQIKEELSHLYIKFRQNQLAETNKIILVIENESDLAGLPAEVREAAAELAKSKGMDKSWAINLQKPSFIPFLQYSERRDLREIVYKGYVNRGNNGDKYDCNEIIAKIASLRVALAQVMGYENYAQYQLTRRMAKTPQAVDDFLHKLWKPSLE